MVVALSCIAALIAYNFLSTVYNSRSNDNVIVLSEPIEPVSNRQNMLLESSQIIINENDLNLSALKSSQSSSSPPDETAVNLKVADSHNTIRPEYNQSAAINDVPLETQFSDEEYNAYMGEPYAKIGYRIGDEYRPLLYDLIKSEPTERDLLLHETMQNRINEFVEQHGDISLNGFKCNVSLCEFRFEDTGTNGMMSFFRQLKGSDSFPESVNVITRTNSERSHYVRYYIFKEESS